MSSTTPRTPPDPSLEPEPFSEAELRAALLHPALAIDVLIAQRERWTASVVRNGSWGLMLALLLFWTFVFSLPYGLVLSLRQAWQIATLFLGSVAICLPSLHVVGAYVGLRVHFAQSVAFASIIAAVAATFSFGFAPILWFMDVTSPGPSGRSTIASLSAFLLSLSALAGAVHGLRCLSLARRMEESSGFALVSTLWLVLLLFIGARMGQALGLT